MSRTAAAGPAALGVALIVLLLGAAVTLAARWPSPDRGDGEEAGPTLTAEGQREALMRQLDRRPRDGRGWVVLGMMEFEADRFESAARAFERAVAVSPRVAADPAVWCEYADALGMAQGGSLAGKPTELIHHALALRSSHPKALEMAGSAAYERRDYVAAAGHWRKLLGQLPEGSRQQAEVMAAIARADRLAAVAPK